MTAAEGRFADALIRSLGDRAESLRAYVRELQRQNYHADPAVVRALEVFAKYTYVVVGEAADDWDEFEDARSRVVQMRSLLRHLLVQEQTVDLLFARAGHGRVPRSLTTLVRGECDGLGLSNVEPILTLGKPANLETIPNIHSWLFSRFRHRPQTLNPRPTFALLTVPYLEGTRPAWYPLVIGHETAHLKIAFEEPLIYERFGIDDLATALYDRFGDLSDHLRGWLTEIVCDLNSLRLYGPAAAAALGEFMEVVGVMPHASRTHPPGWLRFRLMLNALGALEGPSAVIVDPWTSLSQAPSVIEPWVSEVAAYFEQRSDALLAEVMSWGENYSYQTRGEHITCVAHRLVRGIPGSARYAGDGVELTSPDVVNASWLVRELADWKAADEHAPDPVDDLKRIPIDQLATKAIDNLVFVAFWRRAGGGDVLDSATEVGDTTVVAAPLVGLDDAGPSQRSHGVLSGDEIRRRLTIGTRHPDGLVVTPLLPHALGQASLDLRLGTVFITFRRTGVPSFDVLDRLQEPRYMQDLVEKMWGQPFILHPGELVLACTLEYIVMPGDLAAAVGTRSSFGRLGLMTATAANVKPGSCGCLTLELVNQGQMPLTLIPGSRIAQIVFHQVAGFVADCSTELDEIQPPAYRYATGPEFSRVKADLDNGVLAMIQTMTTEVIEGRVEPQDQGLAAGEGVQRRKRL